MVRLAATALALAIVGSAGGAELLLLDFWSPTCGPCMQMKPTIQNFEQAGYPIRQVDVSRDAVLARQFGVERIPCFVMLVDNQEVDRQLGFTTGERLEQMFARAKDVARERAGRRGQSTDTLPQTATMPLPPIAEEPVVATLASNPTPAPTVGGSHANLLAATVRLRVEDAKGHAYGTGTIIDARSGQALVITCGHLFRDSQGKGPITVELFEAGPDGPRVMGQVQAQLISYNLERDIALVGIWPDRPVAVAQLAPKGTPIDRGDRVISVGCNNGQDPTTEETRITTLDRYQGPANIQASGAPVEGRSGGGLFNANGELIGVCFAADYESNEGLYAALDSIRDELTEKGLGDVCNAAAGSVAALGSPSHPPAGPDIIRGQEPLVPVQPLPDAVSVTSIGGNVPVDSSTRVSAASQELNDVEQAAWEEIMSRAAAAEVICIIRPKEPGGQSEVFTLDDVSPEFVRALAARRRSAQATLAR